MEKNSSKVMDFDSVDGNLEFKPGHTAQTVTSNELNIL